MQDLRVFAIDNSILFQKALVDELDKRLPGGSQIEHTAMPTEALNKLASFKPNVIVLNFALGSLLVNQEKFLPMLVKKYPSIPIIAYGIMESAQNSARVLGAACYLKKPSAGQPANGFYDKLIHTILDLQGKAGPAAAPSPPTESRPAPAAARPSAPAATIRPSPVPPRVQTPAAAPAPAPDYSALRSSSGIDLIAMGASTGGTEALTAVITKLRPPLPGIVIVQHIPPMFSRLFAERLNTECRLTVKEAASGDIVLPNHVYIAPGAKHMTISRTGNHYTLECQPGPPVHSVCPSVDVLFDSVAAVAGSRAMGVILTGIGKDGAAGLLKMRRKGSPTIGQDEATSTVYGMPKTAFDMGAVQQQLPLLSIPEAIHKIAK